MAEQAQDPVDDNRSMNDRLKDQAEDIFVDPLPEYLKCPICLCCLTNPYQTPCGHRFCKECILPILCGRNNICPNDRTTIDLNNTFPDNAVKLQINALKIHCPMDNCDWIGELSDKSVHLTKCKFVQELCNWCGTKVLKSKLDEHLKDCPQRKVKCKYCNEDVVFASCELHYDTCPDYPIPCQFQCDHLDTFTRKDIQAHLEVCPRALVPCAMKNYGCSERVERRQLESHLQLCVPHHMGQLCLEIDTLKSEVQELKTALTSQQELVEQVDANLYPSAGQFTWRIDNIREKIKLAQAGDRSTSVIYSPFFYSTEAGYKLSLCIYPAGDNNQDYLSLYFVVMKGQFDEILQWPFQKRVYLSLLNTRGGLSVTKDIQPDPRLHYFHRPENPRNVGYGYPKFMSLVKLLTEESEFVENGALFLRCRIFD